jgi:hypothetical protein
VRDDRPVDEDDGAGELPPAGGDDRAAAGLAHLQAAARELIEAARAVLDVASDLVEDPKAVTAVADTLGSLVRTAATAGRRAVHDDASPSTHGVERIRVE